MTLMRETFLIVIVESENVRTIIVLSSRHPPYIYLFYFIYEIMESQKHDIYF